MTEATFIKRNRAYWKKAESLLNSRQEITVDELSTLYIRLTDDLAWARTYYAGSSATAYLNSLVGLAHQQLYRSRPNTLKQVIRFWHDDLPLLFYRYRAFFLTAFLITALATAIGWLSAEHDDRFARLILGDGYVNMTLENISGNDPMAVYKKMGQTEMFLGITINNIRVSLFAFVFGVFFAVGTAYILFSNGIMLGVFHHMFYAHDLLGPAMSTIWIHGTIEISAIIIAGGAGLVVGAGFLFPGSHTRLHSFKRGVRDGMKITIGLIPFFIVAGFLEGFVTRHTDMPPPLNFAIILLSVGFIFFYVYYYPIQKHKHHQRRFYGSKDTVATSARH